MKNILTQFVSLLIIVIFSSSCGESKADGSGPKKVLVEQIDGNYILTVNGDPFYVKGAGCEFGNISSLAKHGANSFRTWRTDNGKQSGQEVLDAASEHGLMVCMGIEIARERHGFDYDDPQAVKDQFEYVKGEVIKYKDHPALLAWGIGNELNLRATNPKVWDAVNEIAKMIHEVDPNHPATTMLAGFNKELGDELARRCPDVDFLSFQFYADIVNLPKYLKEANYKHPYLVTEWGATGHWESPLTTWGRPIEENSKKKAESYKYRYENVIAVDPVYCLGSYVFLWGQKQERTPTWYGMFLENGNETASVDVMHLMWNGKWPDNRTPVLDSMLMNSQTAYESVTINSNEACIAEVFVSDPEGDQIILNWEIIPEVPEGQESDGGDFEKRQPSVETEFVQTSSGKIEFTGPSEKGQYRLFVYADDGQGHSATANVPFLVK